MNYSKILSVMLILLVTSSCCTIMLSPQQEVGIASNPSGARIIIDGQDIGKTPLTTSLKRSNNHTVKVELEGYLPYELNLTKSVSGWVFGNIIFGGIIGLVVDLATGALYVLTPEQIQANLIKTGMLYNEDNLYFAFVLEPDTSWTKIGNLEKIN